MNKNKSKVGGRIDERKSMYFYFSLKKEMIKKIKQKVGGRIDERKLLLFSQKRNDEKNKTKSGEEQMRENLFSAR